MNFNLLRLNDSILFKKDDLLHFILQLANCLLEIKSLVTCVRRVNEKSEILN
jgi:hypothetical protein